MQIIPEKLSIIILLSVIVGSIGEFNQTSLRKILPFFSISQYLTTWGPTALLPSKGSRAEDFYGP
jgi:hypothetical protein